MFKKIILGSAILAFSSVSLAGTNVCVGIKNNTTSNIVINKIDQKCMHERSDLTRLSGKTVLPGTALTAYANAVSSGARCFKSKSFIRLATTNITDPNSSAKFDFVLSGGNVYLENINEKQYVVSMTSEGKKISCPSDTGSLHYDSYYEVSINPVIPKTK
jgi:hypothetical protein